MATKKEETPETEVDQLKAQVASQAEEIAALEEENKRLDKMLQENEAARKTGLPVISYKGNSYFVRAFPTYLGVKYGPEKLKENPEVVEYLLSKKSACLELVDKKKG